MRERRIGQSVTLAAVLAVVLIPSVCHAVGPNAEVKGRAWNDSNDLPGWCGTGPAGPGPDGYYWSGTVAYAIGKWMGGTGDPIRRVELWVDGLPRYYREWTSNYPSVYPDAIPCDQGWKWVAFSTTQFGHGTTLTLTAKVWTRDGQYAQATDTLHSAWNRAWVGACNENPYWASRAGYARDFFAYASHYSSPVYTTKPAGAILGMIPSYSCFHMSGHGTAYGFHDCLYHFGDPYSDENAVEQTQSDPEISTAVALKEGESPAYNFVFLDTCGSAAQSTLASAFGAFSFLGWQGGMDNTDPYREFVRIFYEQLAAQNSVYDSALAAANASEVTGWQVRGSTGYRVHFTYMPWS